MDKADMYKQLRDIMCDIGNISKRGYMAYIIDKDDMMTLEAAEWKIVNILQKIK